MSGLGVAQRPSTDALGQLLSDYTKLVYTRQLQHLKVRIILVVWFAVIWPKCVCTSDGGDYCHLHFYDWSGGGHFGDRFINEWLSLSASLILGTVVFCIVCRLSWVLRLPIQDCKIGCRLIFLEALMWFCRMWQLHWQLRKLRMPVRWQNCVQPWSQLSTSVERFNFVEFQFFRVVIVIRERESFSGNRLEGVFLWSQLSSVWSVELNADVHSWWQVLQQMKTDEALLSKDEGGSPPSNPSTATEDTRVASLISLEDIYKQAEVGLVP